MAKGGLTTDGTAPTAGAGPASSPTAVLGPGVGLDRATCFCPVCDLPMDDGAVVCTGCGFNRLTGEQLEGQRGPVGPPLSLGAALGQGFLDFFPAFYYPGIVLLALLCAGLASLLAVFTVFVFGLGAYLSALSVGVATLAVWTQAVTLMCVGRAEFFNTALGDIEGTQFGVFMGLVLAPPVLVWTFLGWISNQASG